MGLIAASVHYWACDTRFYSAVYGRYSALLRLQRLFLCLLVKSLPRERAVFEPFQLLYDQEIDPVSREQAKVSRGRSRLCIVLRWSNSISRLCVGLQHDTR